MNTLNQPLRAVIVDDEAHCRAALRDLLATHCQEVEVVHGAENVLSATECLPRLKPDLVFLDIELPDGTGFDVLEATRTLEYNVIFTTAHNEYAVRAIKFAALDYLLKPIDGSELVIAVRKALEKTTLKAQFDQQVDIMMRMIRERTVHPGRIALPTLDGLLFVDMHEIVWCEAKSNYTEFHLSKGAPIIVSKTMKEFEDILEGQNFFRIHHSFIINIEHLHRYVKGKGGYVILSDGKELEVSVRRREEFLEKLGR